MLFLLLVTFLALIAGQALLSYGSSSFLSISTPAQS